jgi:D-alanine-D-alanine ligase-like ATP-grasp enzyme
VFLGYDFHIDKNDDLKLIEINTNAGGALLNSIMFKMKTPKDLCCLSLA